MENTQINKAKFFAQYWLQYVAKLSSEFSDDTMTRIGEVSLQNN